MELKWVLKRLETGFRSVEVYTGAGEFNGEHVQILKSRTDTNMCHFNLEEL